MQQILEESRILQFYFIMRYGFQTMMPIYRDGIIVCIYLEKHKNRGVQ